jgi:hypothetical protein
MRILCAVSLMVFLAMGITFLQPRHGDSAYFRAASPTSEQTADTASALSEKSTRNESQGGHHNASAARAHVDRLQSLASRDLLHTVRIVGELGCPWGTMVTIRGEVRKSDDGKSSRVFLSVQSVNGKKLVPAAEIGVMQIKPFSTSKDVTFEEGKEFELRGYEYGMIMDLPPEAVVASYEEARKVRSSGVGYDYVKFGWRFVPHFHYLNAKQISANGG